MSERRALFIYSAIRNRDPTSRAFRAFRATNKARASPRRETLGAQSAEMRLEIDK
jgi:hypothetical protein